MKWNQFSLLQMLVLVTVICVLATWVQPSIWTLKQIFNNYTAEEYSQHRNSP